MADYWRIVRQAGAAGVLWQDPDIVCDPDDIAAMLEAAKWQPDAVHVAAHKLWPASTGRDKWVWGFGRWVDDMPVMTQRVCTNPEWFAMGLTYTPARLLNLAMSHMFAWHYGQTDMQLSDLARRNHIQIMVCASARPKHLHFYPREGDAAWHPGAVAS